MKWRKRLKMARRVSDSTESEASARNKALKAPYGARVVQQRLADVVLTGDQTFDGLQLAEGGFEVSLHGTPDGQFGSTKTGEELLSSICLYRILAWFYEG